MVPVRSRRILGYPGELVNPSGKPQVTSPSPIVVLLGCAALFVFTSLAAHAYEVERQNLSRKHFARGRELARAGDQRRAVDEYRVALSFSHGDANDQVALAQALIERGSLDEARVYLLELNQKDSTSGIVNLLLARVAAREHRINEAVAYYDRAIYGFWPEASAKNRLAARFELIDLLAKAGDRNRVLAELLQLVSEAPNNPDAEKCVARTLLAFGSPNRAAEVFREILELDPTLPTLSAGQRQQRARDLLERTLGLLDSCTSGSGKPQSGQAEELSSDARKILSSERRGIIEGFTPQALTLAQKLWKTSSAICGPLPDTQEPLAIVLAKLSK